MENKKLGLGFYYTLTTLWGICFVRMLVTGRQPFLVLLIGICFLKSLAITSIKKRQKSG